MPLIKSGSKAAVGKNIQAETAAGKPRAQAIAIALNTARRYAKRAFGGRAGYAGGGEILARQERRVAPSVSTPQPSEQQQQAALVAAALQQQENERLGRLPMFAQPMLRQGYAGGGGPIAGWIGEDVQPADMTRDILPPHLRQQQREGIPGSGLSGGSGAGEALRALAHAYLQAGGDNMRERSRMSFPEQISSAGQNLAGIGRNVKDAAASVLPTFDPQAETARLSHPGTIGENLGDFARQGTSAALAVAPYAGNAERLATSAPAKALLDKLYGTLPRTIATSVAPQAVDDLVSMAQAEGDSAPKASPVDDLRASLKDLQDQRATQKQTQDDSRSRMEANRPKNRAPDEKKDLKFFDAKREYEQASGSMDKLNDRIGQTETKIEGALKQQTSKEGGESLKKQEGEKSLVQSILPYAGPVVGGGLGYMGGAGMKGLTQYLDKTGVNTANKLLPGSGRPKPINQRVGSINDFWMKGGSEQPPFSEASGAPWWKANKADVSAPHELYPPRSRALDWTANTGLTGVYGGEAALGYKWGDDAAAEDKAAQEAFATDKSEGNVQRLLRAERNKEIADFMLRMGLTGALAQGVKGSVGISGTPAPRPNISKAETERADIRQALATSKAKAKAKAEKSGGPNPSKKGSGSPRSPNGALHVLPLGALPLAGSTGDLESPSLPSPTSDVLPDDGHSYGGMVNEPLRHHSAYQPRDEGKFAGGPVYPEPNVSASPARDKGAYRDGGIVMTALRAAARYATGGRVGVGPLQSKDGGRTDTIPTDVEPGSFVLTADFISSLGQNNTPAGMERWKQIEGEAVKRHYGANAPAAKKLAVGGSAEKKVPIMAAGGEYIVPPTAVAAFGGGDVNRGHEKLEKMVMDERQRHIRTLQQLPNPQR